MEGRAERATIKGAPAHQHQEAERAKPPTASLPALHRAARYPFEQYPDRFIGMAADRRSGSGIKGCDAIDELRLMVPKPTVRVGSGDPQEHRPALPGFRCQDSAGHPTVSMENILSIREMIHAKANII